MFIRVNPRRYRLYSSSHKSATCAAIAVTMPAGARASPASGRPALDDDLGQVQHAAIHVAGNADDSGFQSPDEDSFAPKPLVMVSKAVATPTRFSLLTRIRSPQSHRSVARRHWRCHVSVPFAHSGQGLTVSVP